MAVNESVRTRNLGEKYGALTVSKTTEERTDVYIFECSCGAEFRDRRSTVRQHKWQDCGCSGVMTGEVRGSYTITGRADLSTRPKRGRFTARCECGHEIEVTAKTWRGAEKVHRCWANAEMVGKTFGRLTVVAFTGEKDAAGNYIWNCSCVCGNVTQATTVGLNRSNVRSCGCLQKEIATARAKAGYPRTEAPGYDMAHKRVRAVNGPAAEHECVQCGKTAHDWAYDGEDPLEVIAQFTHKGLVYSLNPDHYKPMCKPCHSAFDAQMRRNRKADLVLSAGE